jgi:hypothetical protein
MAKKLQRVTRKLQRVPKGHPPLEFSTDEVERMLLHKAYGHYWLTLVFRGGFPPVELQLDEASHTRLVRSITAVRTLVKNVATRELSEGKTGVS